MQSDIAKSDGIKSDVPIGFPYRKMASVFNQVEKILSRAWYNSSTIRYTEARVAIAALDFEYRTQDLKSKFKVGSLQC